MESLTRVQRKTMRNYCKASTTIDRKVSQPTVPMRYLREDQAISHRRAKQIGRDVAWIYDETNDAIYCSHANRALVAIHSAKENGRSTTNKEATEEKKI